MPEQTLILIGGVRNDDYEWLQGAEGQKSAWSFPKHAHIGDQAFIYVSSPVSAVFATAPVIGEPRPGHEVGSGWQHVGRIGPIHLLPSPIPLNELKSLCPNWGWLRQPRRFAYVPPAEAKIIAKRAGQFVIPLEVIKRCGAGFGDPETNRLVEAASIRAVSQYFRRRGFQIKSREKDRIGYDLDATKARQTLHVEVKGVSGSSLQFPITANEVECAKQDRAFRLAVVTNALNAGHRRIELMTGPQFLRQFKLRSLCYIATRN